MREIKFRAWHEGRMIGMRELCAVIMGDYSALILDILDGDEPEAVIMQYTGLKDKNGKEIYEGDLLGGTYEYSEVGWCEACGGWQCFYDYHDGKVCHCCDGNFLWRELIDDQSEVEVIGNIHENPDLLDTV